MLGRIAEELITLFVVLDPVGAIPIFLHATVRLDARDRQRVALTAAGVALLVLLLFLYCGQLVLAAMHIGIPAFRIAGAAMLFLIALRMVFGGPYREGTAEPHRTATEIAIFPVAMPGIAGPGAMVTVVLLAGHDRTLAEITVTAGLTVAVAACVLATLLAAARLRRLFGAAGIMVITQVMGLVLAAFSVQQVLEGILNVFGRAGG